MTKTRVDVDVPRWAVPLLKPSRYKGAKGGRAAGRSHCFAELLVSTCVADPDMRFVCIREVQKALKYSAKSLIESKIEKMGVSQCFQVMTTEIRRVGGDGVIIFEGMQDHTADSIKSLEGFGRAWVEEAHRFSEKSLRLLRPTIRAPNSEIWFSWNPDDPDDPVDKFFEENRGEHGFVLVEANYNDNPYLPDEMRLEAERDLRNDPELFAHVWGGGYFLGGSGRVYSSFKNRPHPEGNIDETIVDRETEILVGMDFNVNPMTAVVGQRAVDELEVLGSIELQTSNTEEMAAEVRARYPDRTVIVCPDPSGKQRKTSAPVGQTDFTILERAGFEVRSPSKAPLVVDRINNTNKMLYDPETGRRRVRIAPDARTLTVGLTNLVYKEGTSRPEKGKYDHVCDALDYLLWEEFNVLAPVHAETASVRWI